MTETGDARNNYIQNFDVEDSWGTSTCKTEKRTVQDNNKTDAREV
jgi:hypothetical protein